MEKWTIFGSVRSGRTEQTAAPSLGRQTGQYRESWLAGAATHDQKPVWNQCLGQKTWLIMELLEPQCGKTSGKLQGDLVIGEPSQYCEVYLQELNQVSTVNIRGKFFYVSGREEGKRTFWNISERLVFLNKVCPQGRLVMQSPTDLGKGKYLTLAHSSHFLPPQGGEKTEKLGWSSQSISIGSLQGWDLITGLEHFPPPSTSLPHY